MPSRRSWIILLLMVMIAAAVVAVTLNAGMQQLKKDNDALTVRISGLQRTIRLEQNAQTSLPTTAELEQKLAVEKTALERARARLPSSANMVNLIGDLVRKAENNYLIAVPLSSEPPAGDLTKSTYLRASVRLQLTGNETDLMVFLSGLERAGAGDYIVESVALSLDPPAGPDTTPALNESNVTAQATLSLYYRPPTPAAGEART